MLRLARIVVAGAPHPIPRRGNNQQDVVFVDGDRRVYLQFLREYAARYRFRIHGYCLMANPPPADLQSRYLRYSQYINPFHERSGHLWQGRFHSCALDATHYGKALHYVEQNPVRAKMVRKPWRHPWSSAAVHAGAAKDDGLLDQAMWRGELCDEPRWRAVLEQGIDPEFAEDFRRKTHTGRPLASDEFLSQWEALLGRRVRALPIGRPRNTARKRNNQVDVPIPPKRRGRIRIDRTGRGAYTEADELEETANWPMWSAQIAPGCRALQLGKSRAIEVHCQDKRRDGRNIP